MTPEEELILRRREEEQRELQNPQQKQRWSFRNLIKRFTPKKPLIPFEEAMRQIQQQPIQQPKSVPEKFPGQNPIQVTYHLPEHIRREINRRQNILNAHRQVNILGGRPQQMFRPQRQFQPQRTTLSLIGSLYTKPRAVRLNFWRA